MVLDFLSSHRHARVHEHTSPDGSVAEWLSLAEHNDGEAYHHLGLAFSAGSHDVARDLIEAHKWFALAAAQGHAVADACRADIAGELTVRQLNEARSRARLWLVVNNL